MNNVIYRPGVMAAMAQGYTLDEIKDFAVSRWEKQQAKGKTRDEATKDMYEKFGLRANTTSGDVDRAEFLANLMFEPYEEPSQTKPAQEKKVPQKAPTEKPTVPPSDEEVEGRLADLGVPDDDIPQVMNNLQTRNDGPKGPSIGEGRAPSNLFESFLAGYENSTTGLFLRGKTPDIAAPGPTEYLSTALFSAGQMIGDVPTMLAGFGAGSVAGPVGSFAGAMGLSGALRSIMMDSYTRGECTTPQEFFHRAGNALMVGGKDALIGGATAGAGVVAGGMLSASLKPAIDAGSKIAKGTVLAGAFGAEVGAMGTTSSLMEGRLPTASDFISGAASLVGLKGATQGGRVIQRAWVKYGWTPEQVQVQFRQNPHLAEDLVVDATMPYRSPTREVYEVSTSLDKTYAKDSKEANRPESNSGAWMYFDRHEAENKHLMDIAEDARIAPQQKAALKTAKDELDALMAQESRWATEGREYEKGLRDTAYGTIKDEILNKYNMDITDPQTVSFLRDASRHGQGKEKRMATTILSKMKDALDKAMADPDTQLALDYYRTMRESFQADIANAKEAYDIALAKCPPDPVKTPYRVFSDRMVISNKMPIIRINGLGSGGGKVIFDKFINSVEGKKNPLVQEYLKNATSKRKGTGKAATLQKLLDAAPDDFINFIRNTHYTLPEIKKLFGDFVPEDLAKAKIGDKPKFLDGQEIVKDGTYKISFGGIENNSRFLPFRQKLVKPEPAREEPTISEAVETVQKSISFKPTKETFAEKWAKMRTMWTDRVHALNKGTERGQYNNSYIKARMVEASSESAASWLEIGAFNKAGEQMNKGQPSVMKVLNEIPDLDKLSAYLVAENTVNTAQKGHAVTADLDAAITLTRNLKNDPVYLKAVEALQENTKAMLSFMQEHGLISKKEAKELSTHGPVVPVSRLVKTIEKQLLNEKDIQEVAARAHLSEKDAEAWRAAVQAIKEQEKGGELVNPVETLIAGTYMVMRQAKLNEAKQEIAKDWGIAPAKIDEKSGVAYAKNSFEPLTKVEYKKDGKTYSTWVQKDIYEVVQNLDTSNQKLAGAYFKVLTMPTGWLRAGVASDPAFAIRNMIRDQIALGMQSRSGQRPFLDLFHATKLVLQGKWSKEFDNLYQEARRAGGLSGTFVSADRRSMEQIVNGLKSRPFRNVIRDPKTWYEPITYLINPIPKIRSAYRGLQEISAVSENVSRIGEYEAFRKMGYTKEQAAFMMREATLDFSRAGTAMRAWNSISAFANARMQGFIRTIQAMQENPTRFLATLTSYVIVPTLLLAAIDADLQVTDPDSPYAQASRERQPWHRACFYMLPSGNNLDTPLYIPKPQGLFALLTIPLESFLHKMAVEKKFNFSEALKDSGFMQATEGSLPFSPSALMPTAVTPAMEVMANHSFFKENKIVPHNMEKLLPEEQYTAPTSSFAKGIAKILKYANDALPGNTIPEKLRSPLNIDHLIKSYSGTLGKHILEMYDTVSDMTGTGNPNAPVVPLSKFPIVKEFLARFPDYSPYSGTKFFDMYKEHTQVMATVKYLLSKRNATDAERAIELAMEKPFIKLTQIERGLSNINRAVQMVQTTDALTPEEKRYQIDQLMVAYVQMARNGVYLIKQYEEIREQAKNVK